MNGRYLYQEKMKVCHFQLLLERVSGLVLCRRMEMEKINFFKSKYEALEIFYGWVERGYSFDEAVEQSLRHNNKEDELWLIILNITMATRFERCGKPISEIFRKRLENVIKTYKQINLEQCGFEEDELLGLQEDAKEAELLVMP